MHPHWPDVRKSLASAISAALPHQLRRVEGDRVSGIGLHIDGYYGSAGLYLLPESVARTMTPAGRDEIGDWPISTDWVLDDDHARAFAEHWQQWDDWFRDHLDDFTDSAAEQKGRDLLRAACEAVRDVETAGLFDSFPKADDFKVIIAEHDEPTELSVDRYGLFLRTGQVRCHGDDST